MSNADPDLVAHPSARWRFTAIYSVLIAGVVATILLQYGLPIDGWTWTTLGFGLALAAPALIRRRWRWAALPLLYYCSFICPLESHNLADIRGGRRGVKVLPWGARFGKAGCNTRLLESYLGPLEPEWRHASIRSMLLGDWRDGDDRVHTRSIIFRPYLLEALALLPTDDARTQVLSCVTAPDNLLRVHQGLLLTCLWEWGYPEGYDAGGWWRRHEHLFRRESDAPAAARLVAGWTERLRGRDVGIAVIVQVHAARYHEQGNWGGDREFGDAYQELGEAPDAGVMQVVWWPLREAESK